MRNRLRSKAKLEEGAAGYRGQHNIRSSGCRNNSHKAPQHFSFSKEYKVTQTGNHTEACTLRQIADERYQIIAGERRWRASQIAGLSAIPAYIRTIKDENVMEMALIENIQREDLNAIEIALAYEHLLDAEGMTQEKVSERVGKSRTAITNYLRLLRLPAQVQIALQKREIDMGHARALLAVESPSLQIKLFNEVIKNGYSVRKVEEMAQMLKNGEDVDSGKKKIVAKAKLPEEYNALRSHLSDFLQTKVQMTCSPKGKGKITIPFANEEELERIMSAFDKMKQQ